VGNGPTTKTDPSGLEPPQTSPIDLGDGTVIYAVRSSRETLEDELGSCYYARAVTGGFVLPRFFDKGVKTLDDGTIKGDTSIIRQQFLVEYAVKTGVPNDGEFHRVDVPRWTNAFSYVRQRSVRNYWISTPHTLDVSGSYEIRLGNKIGAGVNAFQTAEVRNVDLIWRLTDDVDANDMWNYKWLGGGFGQWCNGLAETALGDIVGDKLLGASYSLEVYFRQTQTGLVPATGPTEEDRR